MARPLEDAARSFVERVMAMVLQMKKDDPKACDTVQALPLDDLHRLALRMFTTREEFRGQWKPTKIILSYHYTDEANMASIRKNGLMNHEERAADKVTSVKEHGHTQGTGVYTATGPYATNSGYGGVGLLVACLLGASADYGTAASSKADSITFRHGTSEYVVVSRAKQCVPILQFQAKQVDARNLEHEGNVVLARYHARLQQILDDVFVSGRECTCCVS
jgi:hypothetical protein